MNKPTDAQDLREQLHKALIDFTEPVGEEKYISDLEDQLIEICHQYTVEARIDELNFVSKQVWGANITPVINSRIANITARVAKLKAERYERRKS